ncbi:hypothetical protein BBP40_001645 [Aspergillus hancockii]|nr:hypothetical protein BBP40_001645 [Aspergillus hancockii]
MRVLQTILVAAIALCTASAASGYESNDVHLTYISDGHSHFQIIKPRHLSDLDYPGFLQVIKSNANCLARSGKGSRPVHIPIGTRKFNPPRYIEAIYCNDPPVNDPPEDDPPSEDPASKEPPVALRDPFDL